MNITEEMFDELTSLIQDETMDTFFTSAEINKITNVEENGNSDMYREEGFTNFTRYNKPRKEHVYTKTEMDAIRASCVNTLVHDYGEKDIYHMSDEDRASNDKLHEISYKLSKLRRVYNNVDEYIIAMRVVCEAWSIIEKNNGLYRGDEFYELVNKGRITSSRIVMPTLRRSKHYNMDMIIMYISNPELDPTDLLPKEIDYDEFDYDDEELVARLLSDDEVNYIINHMDMPEKMKVNNVPNKYINSYANKNIYTYGSKSNKNKLSKYEKLYQESIHGIFDKIQTNKSGYSYSAYSIINNTFMTNDKSTSIFDDIKFNGSWQDDDAVNLYEITINERNMLQSSVENPYRTNSDIALDRFFNTLEANNVNVTELRRKMNATNNGNINKVAKRSNKENKKVEKELIQRITKLNNDPKFKKIVKNAEKNLTNYKSSPDIYM